MLTMNRAREAGGGGWGQSGGEDIENTTLHTTYHLASSCVGKPFLSDVCHDHRLTILYRGYYY